MSDISSLVFVNPDETDKRWRIGLFGAPGVGKTVAACSAPGPIVAVSADRPGAYRYSRRAFPDKVINEARFTGSGTLRDVYAHVRDNQADIGTVILDPFGMIYDEVVSENTTGSKPNWQKVNDVILGAVRNFRDLDVNLILVAHERREQDEANETEPKIYPQFGGPALVQKVMAELDIVARVFSKTDEDGSTRWYGQFATARGYQCKDSSGALGRMRETDVSEWIEAANAAAMPDEDSPLAEAPKKKRAPKTPLVDEEPQDGPPLEGAAQEAIAL